MASRHKSRPTLPAIPIPPNPIASQQGPRITIPNGVSSPLLVKSTSTSRKPPEEDISHVDPDELFVRFTIPEIKSIQSRLRADADAKQEELRLMVGERYRDLLQASTSIISIADSSRRVMGALAEMREAMVPDEPPRKPRSSSIRGKDDAHLKVLQSLSAHLKLLLDAPEHLWRLLEKKQHLQAAWLFLLARVVHRALVTEDPEEGSWESEGISVLTQFPLVQRQWETIAQFRPQIAHRATQYLRESATSSESACSTILTLHLLDSLPLTETLSTLLSQRSRTLNALLARNLDFRSPSRPGSPIFKSRRKNREVAGLLLTPPTVAISRSRSRKDVVRDVREAVIELLDVICGTLRITRDIFRPNGDNGRRKSLVERSLDDIQSDSPPESVLTTSTLLSTLPSSTHLLTLPPSILSYKPYIDLTSPSAQVDLGVLNTKLSAWFDKAMQGFEGRIQAWFAGLESIREVWGLRRRVLDRLQDNQGLDKPEKVKVRRVLDGGVEKRVGEVASAALEDLEDRLDETLRRVVQDVREGLEGSQHDINPPAFLFSAPPIPPLSQMSAGSNSTVSPFKRFKDDLRQRVNGRTPSLDCILGEIERKAREIEDNLDVMDEDDYESRGLQDQVMTLYRQAAQASSTRICQVIERLMNEELVNNDKDLTQVVNVVVFVGRLCYYMRSSSCFRSLRFRSDTIQAIHETLNSLHERSIDCWRAHAVSKAFMECDSLFVSLSRAPVNVEFVWPSQPSPQLINAFLSIMSSLDQLGLPRAEMITKGVTKQALWDFQSAIATMVSVEDHIWQREQVQLLWDLTFLQRMSSMNAAAGESAEAEDALTAKLSALRSHLQSSASEHSFSNLQVHIDRSIDLYLPRSQTLLAPLLTTVSPHRKIHANGNAAKFATTTPKIKPTTLLSWGAPETDQDYKPALETVKPSARFGLLLVGSTAMR